MGSVVNTGREAATRPSGSATGTSGDRSRHEFETDESLWDAAALPHCLEFIKDCARRHAVTEAEAASIARSVNRIEKRMTWPSITLGVIGEFSAGKTTLVNALIGADLLPMDTLQGTTAAITLIEEAPTPFAKASYLDGTKAEVAAASDADEAFRTFVHATITDERQALRLSRLRIGLPSDFLRHGVMLIDTPGLNSLTARHSSEALRVVREYCDAFLVVIPATSPLSESMADFLVKNLQGSVHRCIFLVTKTDLLRGPEEERLVIDTIRDRLRSSLSLAAPPRLFSCSPEISLMGQLGHDPNEGRTRRLSDHRVAAFRAGFTDFKARVIADMERLRPVAKAESLIALTQAGLAKIRTVVEKAVADGDNRRTLLEREAGAAPNDFIDEARTVLLTEMEAEERAAADEARRWKDEARERAIAALQKDLASVADVNKVRGRVSATLEKTVPHVAEELARHLDALADRLVRRGTAGIEALAEGAPRRLRRQAIDALTAGEAVVAVRNAWKPETSRLLAAAKKPCEARFQRHDDQEGESGRRVLFFSIGGLCVGWCVFAAPLVGAGVGFLFACFLDKTQPYTVDEVARLAGEGAGAALDDCHASFVRDASRASAALREHVARVLGDLQASVAAERASAYPARLAELTSHVRQAGEDLARITAFEAVTGSARDKCVARWRINED